jgi:predicted transcriptional regulator
LALISKNASHVQTVRQNALNGIVLWTYYLKNIMDSSTTICNDSLANFCCFLT